MVITDGLNPFVFIHIPRTAGRYFLENLFNKTNYAFNVPFQVDSEDVLNLQYKGRAIRHMNSERILSFYEDQNISEYKFISIVRNPIERFKSCFYALYVQNYHTVLEDYKSFVDFMENRLFYDGSYKLFFRGMKNLQNGWFALQNEYVSRSTIIWKYEDGFGKNFSEWLRDNIGVEIDFNCTYSRQFFDENHDIKNKISRKLLNNVCEYYQTDFEYFGY